MNIKEIRNAIAAQNDLPFLAPLVANALAIMTRDLLWGWRRGQS